MELRLNKESFDALLLEGYSKPFSGDFSEGQSVTAVNGERKQHAVVTRAHNGGWIAKKIE